MPRITLAERTTRFVTILALPKGKDSAGVCDALIDHVNGLPDLMKGTLTWDCGQLVEAAQHMDRGGAPGPATEESVGELRRLRREGLELRSANEILGKASAFFTAELDRPTTR